MRCFVFWIIQPFIKKHEHSILHHTDTYVIYITCLYILISYIIFNLQWINCVLLCVGQNRMKKNRSSQQLGFCALPFPRRQRRGAFEKDEVVDCEKASEHRWQLKIGEGTSVFQVYRNILPSVPYLCNVCSIKTYIDRPICKLFGAYVSAYRSLCPSMQIHACLAISVHDVRHSLVSWRKDVKVSSKAEVLLKSPQKVAATKVPEKEQARLGLDCKGVRWKKGVAASHVVFQKICEH